MRSIYKQNKKLLVMKFLPTLPTTSPIHQNVLLSTLYFTRRGLLSNEKHNPRQQSKLQIEIKVEKYILKLTF